jgi:hypothetical protein
MLTIVHPLQMSLRFVQPNCWISLHNHLAQKADDAFIKNTMLIVLTLFWLLLILCCGFAALAGGKSGQVGSIMMIAATIATWSVELSSSWAQTHIPVMVIDMMLLFGLYALALRSSAYWPIWATGFHMLTIVGHVATMIMPDFRLGIYWRFSSVWSVLVMMSMVIGISIDRTKFNRPN